MLLYCQTINGGQFK